MNETTLRILRSGQGPNPFASGGMSYLYRVEVGHVPALLKVAKLGGVHADCYDRLLDHEARLGRLVRHDHVVKTWAAGRNAAGSYAFLELIPGVDLSKLLSEHAVRRRAVPMRVALTIAAQVAEGLVAIHSARQDDRPLEAIHGDLSLANILVGQDGRVKLCDLGASSSRLGGADRSGNKVVGTLGSIAPERFRGCVIDQRSDVYGLGILMHELLVGRIRRPGERPTSLAARVLSGYALDESRMQRLPRYIAQLMRASTLVDRNRRLQTAAEVLAAIRSRLDRPCSMAEIGRWARDASPQKRSAPLPPTTGFRTEPLTRLEEDHETTRDVWTADTACCRRL